MKSVPRPEQNETEDKAKIEGEEPGSSASSVQPQVSPRTPESKAPRPVKSGLVLIWLVLLLLVSGLGVGAYFVWQWFQSHDFRVLQSVEEDREAQWSALKEIRLELQSESQLRVQLQQELTQARGTLAAEVQEQGARIEAMASIGTDDWRLAEAEYLLRLAGQRLAMEQSGKVLPLLMRVDAILRNLDDAKLAPVRRSLAADIAAVKMAGSVDREGIYLRLSALKDTLTELSLAPDPEANTGAQVGESSDLNEADGEAQSGPVSRAWKRFVNNAGLAFERFRKEHFQVRSLDAPLQPLMAPDQELYLRQNLQLMLSQAQLALLEKQSAIYRESLSKASQWLEAFFQLDDRARFVASELEALEAQQISVHLPDISDSLDRLKQYLDDRGNRHVSGGGSAR